MERPKTNNDIYKDVDNNKNMRRKRITKNNQKRKRFIREKSKSGHKQEILDKIYKKSHTW